MRVPLAVVALFLLPALSVLAHVSRRDDQTLPRPPALPMPPIAEKRPHTTTLHGDTLLDDYFWLRDKANPQVMDYLHAEDRYADTVMQPTEALQGALYQEILSHIKQTDVSVPYRMGNFLYYTRTQEGQQYPTICRKLESPDAREEILLDQNEMAKGHSFLSVGVWRVSDDGNVLAYAVDTTGYRQYTMQIKNLRTGQLTPERVERVDNIVWATDNRTLFYVTEDDVTKRQNKLFRHVLGTDQHDLVYEEKDELFDVDVARTRDKAIILMQASSKTSTETRYLPADRPTADLKIVVPRQADHEYDVDHRGDLFYIRTNKGAKNFRVVTAPVSNPSENNWKEFVAHRAAVKVDGVDLFADHAALSEWENGLQQIEVVNLTTATRRRVTYPEPVYAAALSQNTEFATSMLRYTYQSLVTPSSVFDYDMNAGSSTLLKQTEVPGGFDRTNYVSERLYATASDGTKIPLSVVYRKGLKKDGAAPMLLYAYGSYGISTSPTFSAARLPLLDRGVVYAIAHVRGGGELGEEWRDAGRMMQKMNTFTDFIASAEYLVAQKYTSSQKLVVQGGSAGGMLMGGIANMRPDLFKAVIAQVPFVDVINTMLDASLPLTTSEYIEWGNPNEKPAFDYMMRYSPYDNVRRQAYPAMLVKVSVNDSQVPYWEGAKLTAKLRAFKTNDNPLLLKVNFGAGHGGSSGRYDALRETAFNWAFALWQTGTASPPALPRVFLLNPAHVVETRDALKRGDSTLLPAWNTLRADADKALALDPFSVVNKSVTPPSGDKHDYTSQAPYFWPNPATPGGLPYIRRDGERNPEINGIKDHAALDGLIGAVDTLALAAFLGADERYSLKAGGLLRAWFVDPATRMNPNLEYAQFIPGVNTGRGIGLIETRGLARLVDAIGLLEASPGWRQEDGRALREWFARFLSWMQDSPHGRDESAATNNHGTFYDVQIASFSLLLDQTAPARDILEAVKTKRVTVQVEPDGRQPLELARTNSWGYSTMNLDGLTQLATLGDRVGVDLWHYRTSDGRGIRAALDYLAPFGLDGRKWPDQQISDFTPAALIPILRRAAAHYDDDSFGRMMAKVPKLSATERTALVGAR